MEDQISEILQEEEEKALIRAQMEVAKAENMIEYRMERLSRPRKTWFITEREMKEDAKAAKAEKRIEYKLEILSRPRKTWFITEREKKEVAKAAKESSVKEGGGCEEIVSAERAEETK